MTGTAESIRQGRGMLPKNLQWYLAVFLAVAGAAVIYSSHKQEQARTVEKADTKKAASEEDVRKKTPDLVRLITESANQAKDISQQASQGQTQDYRKAKSASDVPGIQTNPRDLINSQQDAATGYGGSVSNGNEARHAQATVATSPILALSDSSDAVKPTVQPHSTADPFQQDLMFRQTQQPQMSADDRKLLEEASGKSQPQTTLQGEEYLENAKRNEQWLQKNAASTPPRKTLTLDSKVSPYTVTQGSVIPAVVVSPINSDLPGQIIARTTQNIYDSIRGRYLLIPSGSLIYGLYNNAVVVGQDRLAVVFNRIVFPDGSGVTLGAMPGTDAAGQAGVSGEVDNHFWKMFGSSMLVAGIASLFEPKQSGTTNNYYVSGSSGSMTSAAGQVLVDVSRSILGRNARIPPTVTVKQGERFNIVVQQDMGLSPYAGEDINDH
ncbi:MAG: TrbI/VirB10 family protein [Georgfuchsia sp.]